MRQRSPVSGPGHKPAILQLCAVDFTARHFLLPLMEAQRQAAGKQRLPRAVLQGADPDPGTSHQPKAKIPVERWFSYRPMMGIVPYAPMVCRVRNT